jgi:hypothetical protein
MSTKILELFKSKNYVITDLMIVGVEDSTADLKPLPNGTGDTFNDRLIILTKDGKALANVACTTEPGLYYTRNRLNSHGAARVAFGQYINVWSRHGQHKNQPKTLVQVNPITVVRDSDNSMTRNGADKTMSGLYGINLHTTGAGPGSSPSSIGRWSAGCTVVQNSGSFYELIVPLLHGASTRDDFGTKPGLYNYTLISAEMLV